MNLTADKNNVNLFFACDNSYIPFLCVTLKSICENVDKQRRYIMRILHTDVSEQYKEKILREFNRDNISLEFVNIEDTVRGIFSKLHTRDYYSKTTYYRLFIPNLYKNLDKALYLDGDLVVKDDIAKLYDIELGDNLVGAASDGFVNSVDVLTSYAKNRIGIPDVRDYFNAGVLLMNLKAMRESNFEELFLKLVSEIKFNVAQDQDYLNVMCKGRRVDVGDEWNCMPFYTLSLKESKIIHYTLDNKPWRKDGVQYEELFSKYKENSIFDKEIDEIKKSYTKEMQDQAKRDTKELLNIAYRQSCNEKENIRIKEKIDNIKRIVAGDVLHA